MPATVSHALSATTPDDPTYEIRPSHWNSNHLVTLSATAGTEIFGAFSNDPAFNVTFSTNAGGQVVASANVTAAPSPVNVTGANGSSVNAQTIAFSNSNGMTLGVSTAANGATITGSYTVPSTANLISRINVSAGTTSNNLSAVAFADSNGLSFGLNAGTVTASHNGLTSQSNQNVTAQNGGFAFQTLSFSNANGISFGTSAGSAITASHNALTTARASNDAIGLNTAQSNVTWTANSSGLSLDARGYAGTATAVTGGAAITLNSGGLSFNGASLAGTSSGFTGANISASITHNTAGLALSMSVAAPGGGANFSAGVSGGNTSGDTGVTGTRVVFAGGNNVTLSQATDANGATITISGANAGGAQTGISGIQVSDNTFTSGTVAWKNANGISFGSSGANGVSASYTVPSVTNSSWTVSDNATSATVGRLAFTQSNGITMSLSTSNNGNHTVIASHNGLTSQSNQNVTAANGGFAFQTLSFSNANAFSFGTSAGSAITGSYTVPAVTDFFSKTNTTFNGANISGSITNNTNGLQLSLSVAAPGAAAENNAINLLGANTAGNTTATGSTIGWSGVNLTLSGTNNSQVVVSAPATSSMIGTNGINISTNGSTISIAPATIDLYVNLAAAQGSASAAMTQGSYSNGTINLFPLNPAPQLFPGVMTVDRFGMLWSGNHTNTSQSTQAFSSTFAVGIYTQNNATQLSRLYSGTWTTQGSANANNSSLLGGIRWITLAASNWDTQPVLTQGNYWGAVFALTGGTSVGAASMGPVVVRAGVTGGLSGIFGSASASANSNAVRFPFDGYMSASTNALPNAIALADVIHTGSGYGQMIPMIAAVGSGKTGGFGYW